MYSNTIPKAFLTPHQNAIAPYSTQADIHLNQKRKTGKTRLNKIGDRFYSCKESGRRFDGCPNPCWFFFLKVLQSLFDQGPGFVIITTLMGFILFHLCHVFCPGIPLALHLENRISRINNQTMVQKTQVVFHEDNVMTKLAGKKIFLEPQGPLSVSSQPCQS